MEKIKFILDNKEAILMTSAGLLEVLVRVYPTKRNLSVLEGFNKLLNKLIPNRIKQ